WRAGRHFTYHGSPLYPGTDERDPNNVKWKGDQRTDLRIDRLIKIGPFKFKPYIEVHNLFDYTYFYLPEGAEPGFGINLWPDAPETFMKYMDWVKRNGKIPGDHRGVPENALSRHWFLIMNQPRDFYFGIDVDF
ncbi:MAG: hypothetical protein JSW07_15875, partial [bacterium]